MSDKPPLLQTHLFKDVRKRGTGLGKDGEVLTHCGFSTDRCILAYDENKNVPVVFVELAHVYAVLGVDRMIMYLDKLGFKFTEPEELK